MYEVRRNEVVIQKPVFYTARSKDWSLSGEVFVPADETGDRFKRTIEYSFEPTVAPERVPAKFSIHPFFRWYDLWVGAYYDRHNRVLYICPLPMFGISIQFPE